MPAEAVTRSILCGLTGLRLGGGIASVSRCVARALDELVDQQRLERTDRVLLLEDPSAAAPPPRRGRQQLARGSQPRFVLQLWWSYLRQHHDLVFFDLLGLARSAGLALSPLRNARYAVFAHGLELTVDLEGSREQALRRAWRVLTNSESTARTLRERFPELAPRLRPIPLCIDPERVALWQQHEPPSAAPREPAALIVGRIWSEERGKGHDALLEAWPEVRRRMPGAQLWIVGTGDDCGRLGTKARELGVGEAVRFLGEVSDEELGRLYRRASVFAMPSRQEGFGLVYAEAMWHGLPCIGSTRDAAGEVIRDGETGLLIPYGDAAATAAAVASLLSDPDLGRRLGEAGARRAREVFAYPRFRSDLLRALEL